MDMWPFAPSNAAHAVREAETGEPRERLWIAMGTAALAEHMVYEAREAFKELPLLGGPTDQVNFMLAGCTAILRDLYSQMEAARKGLAETSP